MIRDENNVISFVEFDKTDNWESVFRICPGYLTEYAKERIRGINVKCVLIETQYIDKDYRNTYSKFHSKKFVTPKERCIRLHLFSNLIDFENPDSLIWQEHYSGYIILRPTLPNSIGRTLLSPELFINEKCYLCLCTENVMVNGIDMEIEGFPFISQDTDATVCAQSSLWMLLRFFSNRYRWYKEIYPFDLTCLVKAHPQGRSFPGAGLTMVQMADALRDLSIAPLLYCKNQYGKDFFKYVYNYIESGFPLLLGLPEHVVVGIGHISDLTLTGSTSSYDFFQGIVINDDNGLPYAKITANKMDNPFNLTIDQIDSFLVSLPEKVLLSAEQFEELVQELIPLFKKKGIVIPGFKRIFLTTGRSFKKKALKRYRDIPEVQKFYLKIPLPHFIWVCELSEPELYSKHLKCVGEIIWDATSNVFDSQFGLVIHLPEILIFNQGAAINSEADYCQIPVGNIPYSIYNNNLKEIV